MHGRRGDGRGGAGARQDAARAWDNDIVHPVRAISLRFLSFGPCPQSHISGTYRALPQPPSAVRRLFPHKQCASVAAAMGTGAGPRRTLSSVGRGCRRSFPGMNMSSRGCLRGDLRRLWVGHLEPSQASE